ncbi:hypothetical protein PtA15_6A706 [Puccinia triticina]|uniref:Uncharacterized protein n=1 Tax=Puccinia triticina TaxID=208348 RepID=A0ABY7CLG1_9BASI|nr:uncharacterized protein PtA15_6A706 [Puccinia triticina]WAQ86076.1 hypothetical protein PtA15_6A706 [Puccinia triticina]
MPDICRAEKDTRSSPASIMPTCAKCQRWTSAALTFSWCSKCLKGTGSHDKSEASSHNPPSFVNSFDSQPTSHSRPKKKPTSSRIRPLSDSTSSSSQPPVGSKEYFRSAITAKRKKPSAAPYPKKKPTTAALKETKFAPSPNIRLIDCGLVLYKGKKPANNPLLFNIKQTVDVNNPNLFEELRAQLLSRFTPEILQKLSLDRLPRHAEQNASLLHGKSRLLDLNSLVFVVHKSTDRKPIQVDLAYQHPCEDSDSNKNQDEYSDSSEYLPSKAPSCRRKAQKISSDSDSPSSDAELPSIEVLSTRPHTQKTFSNYKSHPSDSNRTNKSHPARPSKAVKKSDSWAANGVAWVLQVYLPKSVTLAGLYPQRFQSILQAGSTHTA